MSHYIDFEVNLDVALTLSVILLAFSFIILLIVKGVLEGQDNRPV